MTLTPSLRRILWGVGLIAAVAALGLFLSSNGWNNSVDRGWMDAMVDIRTEPFTAIALAFDWVGAGWRATMVMPLIVIAAFLLLRRPWSALIFAASLILSVALVQLLKNVFGRARPEEILVHSDFGSFPSGHAGNAATLGVVLILLLRKGWMWAVGVIWIIFMMLSRTYLGAHWVSDTVAGALVGTGAALIAFGALSTLRAREESRTDADR